MSKRRYPFNLFIFGVISNLIRTFYVGAVVILLLIFSLVGSSLLKKISGGLFLVWIIYAIIEQVIIKKTSLTQSQNDQFNNIMEAFLDENGPFSKSKNKTDIDNILNGINSQPGDTKDDGYSGM